MYIIHISKLTLHTLTLFLLPPPPPFLLLILLITS